ncbi:hypothetical protein FD19_GL001775 [Lacticaseibacillus thailandensis DSM 22698 = JCM 13996]|uniref:L,D-TPase catalytic domain-containing protein n=2 Tax=Lacticaseibacillus thailandensis TaxID=381741 RepID=A0A0R2C9P9_9LACO|nr:hypothetical protein FD19_GL001775 [Lacticaseibacillus thailandensis DSM 22698 = JCM 13996]
MIAVGGVSAYTMHSQHTEAVAKAAKSSSSKASAAKASSKQAAKKAVKQKTVDYTKPSENKAYPDVNKYPNLWIHVSTEKQRVYIMNGDKVLYTMYCSTGMTNSKTTATPHGTYHVQAERGQTFYNAAEREGANYYTSWAGHGSLLFHSVPIDANGNYIKSEAAKLGKKGGASHGCVRLTIPDAKWIYENIKYNTKVVIN